MFGRVDVTIAPNEKYRRVIGVYKPNCEGADDTDSVSQDDSEDQTDDYEDWPEEHKEAADDFAELMDNAVDPEEHGVDTDEIPTLSWDDISPSSDPDLVAKIATYFDGMSPDEPLEQLRSKCRLLDVEIYVDAQVAAREELRG